MKLKLFRTTFIAIDDIGDLWKTKFHKVNKAIKFAKDHTCSISSFIIVVKKPFNGRVRLFQTRRSVGGNEKRMKFLEGALPNNDR
jgi:hypothetical protein